MGFTIDGKFESFTKKQAQDIADSIQRAFNDQDPSITYMVWLGDDKNYPQYRWAVAIAWRDGFDSETGYELCAKVAYIHSNSVMTEYDMDFIMPKYKGGVDCYDTEISCITYDYADIISTIAYLDQSYQFILQGNTEF